MHPFYLGQVVYTVIIVIWLIILITYEKVIAKKRFEKTKIMINVMTLILLLSLFISIVFFLMYDYSLIFPFDYYQPHNYLFLAFAIILFISIYGRKGMDVTTIRQRDKVTLNITLFYMIMLLIFIPTYEKVFDRFQYIKASYSFEETEQGIDVNITNDMTSCREFAPYRKSYQTFECVMGKSRDYFVFAKNNSSKVKEVIIRLELYTSNKELVKTLKSEKLTFHPNEVQKLVFDHEALRQPNWMQYSFQIDETFQTYRIYIEPVES